MRKKKKALRHTPIKVMAIYDPRYDEPLLVGTPLLELEPEATPKIYAARWPVEGCRKTGKYILSGSGRAHYVHHFSAMQRLPVLSLLLGSLLKYVAAHRHLFELASGIVLFNRRMGGATAFKKLVSLYQSNFLEESVSLICPLDMRQYRLSEGLIWEKKTFLLFSSTQSR
ncbi:MAG: hypothetical protein M5U34_07545 [Chloroflexi bacterium]|nr:hypothetical protein [Chloroflexota bacterium]